jgi:hypothetical protein
VRGDGGCEDEVAEALGGEDFAGVFGAENDAIDVGGHEVFVGVEGLLEEGLGIAGSGVGDEDVEFAEVGYDLLDRSLYGCGIGYIDAVGFGFDAVL